MTTRLLTAALLVAVILAAAVLGPTLDRIEEEQKMQAYVIAHHRILASVADQRPRVCDTARDGYRFEWPRAK